MYARFFAITLASVLAFSSCAAKKSEIDQHESATLKRLFKEQPKARTLFNQSYGYATFEATQTAFALSGGSGNGVAVNRKTGKETYMKMGSVGAGIGFGFQVLDVVFLFQTKDTFDNFVEKGWDANTSASAAASKEGEGINKDASFTNGVMIYQMTDKGLIAQASLKGTKYWKDDDLNKKK